MREEGARWLVRVSGGKGVWRAKCEDVQCEVGEAVDATGVTCVICAKVEVVGVGRR